MVPSWSQVVSGLFNSVFSLGLVACIVSHYRMGARSWSERRSRPAPHDPQPYQHVLLPPVQSVRAVLVCQRGGAPAGRPGRGARRPGARGVGAHRLGARAASDGALPEEHAGSVRLRDADQEQELYGACVRAPPNRTVRDGSPPCGGGGGRLRRVVVRSNSVTPCNRTARWHSPDCQRPGGV
ncbi:hypothetical protein HPB51_023578 [Rhipicephalus microplus]|uniref:Uncharacterized protein n=1 Tax=Rhipicephalus microplus TaxID=6941 RepID=A0A9J6DCY6_RHIMP|nr:hypothetical protein HPB51_023578 [Rhipicephalus microplus]